MRFDDEDELEWKDDMEEEEEQGPSPEGRYWRFRETKLATDLFESG